ncbi:carbohydrate sulfotransferase 11-like [Anneissia japonica]|uniref:carbohydrate sulfotransferase 11-like n=1 Tax=Anneissia japonica TaxID=1529436 RepID=UPI001425BA96|nr:carbohydrate sulfotransferase 11-like [Anneissia japonica]
MAKSSSVILAFVVMMIIGYGLVVLKSSPSYYYTSPLAVSRHGAQHSSKEPVVVTRSQADDVTTHETLQFQDEFMKKYSAISKKGIDYTRKMCKKYRSVVSTMESFPNVLVNEKYKLVYCQTAKAGTVSWCKMLLILSGYKNYSEVVKMSAPQVSNAWKKQVSQLKRFSTQKQTEIISTYTKIMIVRNPYTRLLSAYNDKLVAKNASDYRIGHQRMLSQKILKRFRQGNITGKYDPTFGEFVKMIISEEYYIHNVHWRSMESRCHPCDMNYDVIGRFEDIENYSNYILKRIGAGIEFPHSSGTHFTNSSSHDKVKQSYATIPDEDLEDLYQKYLYDFQLFGYEKELPKA